MNENSENDKTTTHVLLTPGIMINQYKVVEKIGAGGMGEIYLVDDTSLERQVALKFLPAGLTTNQELKTRFIREAKAVAKLSHPNIVTVFEVGEFSGRPFFAMEYVPGKTLKELGKTGSVSVHDIIDIAIQLCQGLGEAHRKGIIHRDIKAANIIIDSTNRVRILDFGLASVIGSEELTKAGSTLGTLAYMSPEQVSGHSIDHRSDLFSLGVVIYELLCGQLPFKRDNEGATLQAIMQDNPEPVSRFKSAVPDQLQQIISKLLEKNLELRYQSAEGVLADLKRLLYDSHQTTGSVQLNKVDDKSIVVIPFNNLSSDQDNEYFSDGLTEEIITDLSGIGELRVISRNSSLLLKGTKKEIPVIGRELNIRYALTGSVRKAGNNVRITAQLVDAVTNQQIWADKYKGTLEDIFEIQEEVSQSIVSTLKVKLSDNEQKQLTVHPIEDPKAYELFLRAKQQIQNWSIEGLGKAESLLKQALEITGDNALLYVTLAHLNYQYINIGVRQEEHLSTIQEYVKKAEAINPNLVELHLIRSFIAQTFSKDKGESIRHLKKVLEIDSNNNPAKIWLAIEYAMVGRTDKARNFVNEVILADPLSTSARSTLGWVELMSGNFDSMLAANLKTVEFEPESKFHRNRMLHVYSYLGEIEKAGKYLNGLTGDRFDQRLGLSLYYGVCGEKEKSLGYINDDAIATAKRDPQYSMFFAMTYCANGMIDETIDWIENAFDEGFLNYPYLSEHDPHLKKLKSNQRYADLLAKIKIKWEAFDE